jgi:hypothetical protein
MTLEPRLRSNLRALFSAYQAATGRPLATIGKMVLGDPKAPSLLEEGRNFTVQLYDRMVGAVSDKWPDGAPWPEGVGRWSLADAAPARTRNRKSTDGVPAASEEGCGP